MRTSGFGGSAACACSSDSRAGTSEVRSEEDVVVVVLSRERVECGSWYDWKGMVDGGVGAGCGLKGWECC